MPNWTTNKIICKKSIGDKILSKENDDYILDFNKIIPMPEELQIEAGSRGQRGLMYLYSKTDSIEEKEIINKAYKSLNPFLKIFIKIVNMLRLIMILLNMKRITILRNQ